jgi:transposase
MSCHCAENDPDLEVAIRFSPPIRRWYDRKCGKRHKVIATKAVAHKLARAGYFLMRDGCTFDVQRAFS